MAFTTAELNEHAGLNTDGILGFETQVSSRQAKREVVWPEHFVGKRVDDFRRGSRIARDWMNMRRGTGTYRRSARQKELKEIGIMTVMRASNAAELKAEQIETLKSVVDMLRMVDAIMEEDNAADIPAGPRP